jgi:hypothetical protein
VRRRPGQAAPPPGRARGTPPGAAIPANRRRGKAGRSPVYPPNAGLGRQRLRFVVKLEYPLGRRVIGNVPAAVASSSSFRARLPRVTVVRPSRLPTSSRSLAAKGAPCTCCSHAREVEDYPRHPLKANAKPYGALFGPGDTCALAHAHARARDDRAPPPLARTRSRTKGRRRPALAASSVRPTATTAPRI